MSTDLTIDDLLVGYAAGRLPESVRFLVANHIELSPKCRQMAHLCDSVGAAMFETLPKAAIPQNMFANVLCAIDDAEPIAKQIKEEEFDLDLPMPLRRRLGRPVDQIEWREFSGIGEYVLPADDDDGYSTKLIRVRAGKAVPQHTHEGDELTLILRGAFSDNTGRYARGDLAIADHDVDHQPVAEPGEDCLCLAVTNAPIRLSGTITRFLNPFLHF